jgi:hypothetical protein
MPRGSHAKAFFRLRKLDDQQPLVLTGYMRDQVLKNVVRGFPSRATVYLYGPKYMGAKLSNSYRGKSDSDKSKYAAVQPDKARK